MIPVGVLANEKVLFTPFWVPLTTISTSGSPEGDIPEVPLKPEEPEDPPAPVLPDDPEDPEDPEVPASAMIAHWAGEVSGVFPILSLIRET